MSDKNRFLEACIETINKILSEYPNSKREDLRLHMSIDFYENLKREVEKSSYGFVTDSTAPGAPMVEGVRLVVDP